MHWTMCSADVTSELVKLDPEIIDIKNRTITLQWSTDRVCSSLVEGYSLTFCKIHRPSPNQVTKEEESAQRCLEEPTKLTISNTAKKYTIKNLKPYSTYRMQMNMFSKLASGNFSDPQFINTHEDGKLHLHSHLLLFNFN